VTQYARRQRRLLLFEMFQALLMENQQQYNIHQILHELMSLLILIAPHYFRRSTP
jgi:hypothetical protein